MDWLSTKTSNMTSPLIHPHWMQYYNTNHLPAPRWAYFATGLITTVTGIIGIIGNVVLWSAFSCCQQLRSPSNSLIANLALSDLGLSIGTFPVTSLNAFSEGWMFGEEGCSFWGLWMEHFALLNIATMTVIAWDRYFSITKKRNWNLTYTRVWLMIVGIWIFALGLSIPPSFGWSQYILDSMQISCTFDFLTDSSPHTGFIVYTFLLGFALPLFIIFICYTLLIRHFIRHYKSMKIAKVTQPFGGGRSSSGGNAVTYNSRASLISIVIVFFYCFSWAFYAVLPLFSILGGRSFLTPTATTISFLFSRTSAIYNPFIYMFLNEQFQRVFRANPVLRPTPTSSAEAIQMRPTARVTFSESTKIMYTADVTATSPGGNWRQL